MTFSGTPEQFGLPPKKVDEGTISDDQYLELIRLVKSLLKRVDALEERTGITKKPQVPCLFCNVLNAHQPWCEKNANRV